MQVQTQNIQRPALFSDFFGLELMWNNEYLTHIHTFKNSVTSIIHNNIEKIKKSLNPDNSLIKNILNKINSREKESLQDFSNKYSEMIYREQDRRLGR